MNDAIGSNDVGFDDGCLVDGNFAIGDCDGDFGTVESLDLAGLDVCGHDLTGDDVILEDGRKFLFVFRF